MDDLVTLMQKDMESVVENAEITDSKPIEINGLRGRQFEVKGSVEKLRVTYIFFVLETEEQYYQIMSWTLTSRFQKNKPILRDVMSSFKLTKTADRISVSPPKRFETKTIRTQLTLRFVAVFYQNEIAIGNSANEKKLAPIVSPRKTH